MDAREFKQRFMPHYKLLYRVAYHLTANAQDAEDLLQDLYLKLWQKREGHYHSTASCGWRDVYMGDIGPCGCNGF